MSIAIANTFSRTMGISFHLPFRDSAIRERIGVIASPPIFEQR
jgi:hypothetical protein